MARRIMALSFATMTALALMLALASPAFARSGASGTNADCARCHEGRALRSGVPAAAFDAKVSYSKCRTCHWLSGRTRVGYYTHRHQAGTICYGCHPGYSAGPAFYPNVRTGAGYFVTANYTQLSAAEMHRIHVIGSWPQSGAPAECASCHAPAACDACHSVPTGHSSHAYNRTSKDAQYAPAAARITRGTREGVTGSVTARVEAVSCVNARCHVVSDGGSAISRPTCESCHVSYAAFSAPRPSTVRPGRTAARR
jgi:hypothetical protein